jgi:hypothetical protein
MAMSLTDSLKQNRYIVVAVDTTGGRVRLKSEAEVCSDLTCGGAVVVTDEGQGTDLGLINAGDIVTMEQHEGHATRIVVVRRVYEEYSSPEW